MQLKKHRIRTALTTATCTLLGNSMAETTRAAETTPWEIDTAFLYYKEFSRVTVAEPVVNVRKTINDDQIINVRMVLDALTGASANGAIPTDTVQTFTTPSGESSYTSNVNETPLDPSFSDARAAIDVSWETPLQELSKIRWGGSFSREYDYISYGISASISQDFNTRNTTLTGSFSFNKDHSKPIGTAPVGLSIMPATTATQKQTLPGDQIKNISDVMLGLTQIINRVSFMQFNYGYGTSRGYLTDPYKILSVVDTNADTTHYVYEKRPAERTKQTLYFNFVRQIDDNVLRTSYRYFWDDWDIQSHTLDLRYRYELGSNHFLQPHLRYYTQTNANFYRYFLRDSDNPQFASADYRLGTMTSRTFGILYGIDINALSQFNFRIEKLTQSGEGRPNSSYGKMRNQNLFPDINTIIVQLGYSFTF